MQGGNLSTLEAKAGRLLSISGQPGLHSKLKATLDYRVRPYLKGEKKKDKKKRKRQRNKKEERKKLSSLIFQHALQGDRGGV